MRYLPKGGTGVRGIVFLAIVVLGAIGRSMSHSDINADIRSECQEINAKCPETISPELRLDNVTPGDHRATFNFSFTKKVDLSAEDLEEMKAQMIADARKDADFRELLDKKVTLGFRFCDTAGKQVLQFDITPNR